MKDGGWRMGDGGWGMGDGGWGMGDGGWGMEDEGWRIGDGGWRMEDEGWRMEDGGRREDRSGTIQLNTYPEDFLPQVLKMRLNLLNLLPYQNIGDGPARGLSCSPLPVPNVLEEILQKISTVNIKTGVGRKR
jgi:hypothetical protein